MCECMCVCVSVLSLRKMRTHLMMVHMYYAWQDLNKLDRNVVNLSANLIIALNERLKLVVVALCNKIVKFSGPWGLDVLHQVFWPSIVSE